MEKRDKKFAYLLLSLCIIFPTTTKSYADNFKCLKPDNTSSSKILENTLSNNPKSKTAKLCCAKVYLKNGDFKEAENLIMQVLEEEPTHKKANQLLKELNKSYSKHIENERASSNLSEVTPEPVDIIIEKEQTIQETPIIANSSPEIKQQNDKTFKLPTKEELLKKAKERKLAESKATNSKSSKNNKDKKNTKTVLEEKQKFIRFQLAQTVDLRRTPTIDFKYDDSSEKAAKVFEILEKIENEKK